jgi:hypothetical protein
MKRALPGNKRKKATPARKPVAPRPSLRKKSSPAKATAKKAAPARKPKAKTTKPKVGKRKIVRLKVAKTKAAQPKTKIVSKRKPAKPVATRTKRVPVVAKTTPLTSAAAPAKLRTKLKVARKTVRQTKTPALAFGTAAPAVTFAIEADEELALPASVLPESSTAGRKTTLKPDRKNGRKAVPEPSFTVPAFLLEGDEPSHLEVGGPGEKFSLGPTVSHEHFSEAIAPLPEAYGTGKLFLTARDPHWLYAHWDFTREEQFHHNARSMDHHLVLRVHNTAPLAPVGKPVAEYHVHPESKHWFVHVDRAGEIYKTELGYYRTGRKWQSLAFSAPQRTPPDNISTDSAVKFATIPAELSFGTMLSLLKETAGASVAQNTPLAHAVDKIKPLAREHFPKAAAPGDWSPEQAQALADVLATDRTRVALPSSGEFVAETSLPEFAFDYETGETKPISSASYVSSFFGGAGSKDFWFDVNAELVIYGTTEPNATVTFAGKQIQLRPDGSFRFRFALPDGQYELPVTVVSADGTDGRAAELKFTRDTEVRGHVAVAPADPALKSPPGGGA